MKRTILTLIFVISGTLLAQAQWSILENDASKNVDDWLTQKFTIEEWNASNYASDEDIKWFNDARYGMFIHFGLSTYVGRDLSWGVCYTRKSPDSGHGIIPDSIWKKYPQYFVFSSFNAKKWVETAQNAGMKYMVIVAKHHDGFHMWDTKFSDFKVTNTPFGRDYLKELADACHAKGMKFGIYYSQRDWYHPDYSPVDSSLIEQIDDPPYFKKKPGVNKIVPGVNHHKYIDYQFNAVRELCTNYGKVDIFWFDAVYWKGMFTSDMWQSEKLTRMIRKLQPGIIINNRASIPGDFDTPEQAIGMYQKRPWETCMSLCSSWSWSDTPVKSTNSIIKILTNTACANGNLLLSWGPKWDGVFDSAQEKRLEEVGEWLKQYGYSIYNTKGGPWCPEKWGGSTYRGNKAFIHITGETGKQLNLHAISNNIITIKCLTGGEVNFTQNNSSVIINLEKTNTDQQSRILELSFEKEITGMVEK